MPPQPLPSLFDTLTNRTRIHGRINTIMIDKKRHARAASFHVLSNADRESLSSKHDCTQGRHVNTCSSVLNALRPTDQANSVEHTIQKKVCVINTCILRNFRHHQRCLFKTLSGLLLTWRASVATFTLDLNVDLTSLINTTIKSCLHMTFLKQFVRQLLMQRQNDLSILVTRITPYRPQLITSRVA
ncbi:hypothetical protein Rcae01_01530 [Novipirellula caenicola]|uniref:Uncharacterized protein n=1 Tax=Novipirellula caenicola TaxID=1536901 RepID=A0ABP9VNB3_9BACT